MEDEDWKSWKVDGEERRKEEEDGRKGGIYSFGKGKKNVQNHTLYPKITLDIQDRPTTRDAIGTARSLPSPKIDLSRKAS